MLDRLFQLRQHKTSVVTEVVAGVVTFMTLSYILFVQPAVLSSPPCNMPYGSVLLATCVASGIACILMGLLANLPIALAPAMGHNFFFAFTVCQLTAMGGFGFSWQAALAANFISGAIFVALSWVGLREAVMQSIPPSLKYAIAVGIGLLIAFIGFEWAGIIVHHPVLYVQLGNLRDPVVLLSLFGLAVTSLLLCWKVKGAILIGIILTALAGLAAGELFPAVQETPLVTTPDRILGFPEKAFAATFALDFGDLFSRHWVDIIVVMLILLFLDLFDTVGTLVGVSERAGLIDNEGRVPRARQALFSDAAGTVTGTLLGTSTVTSYIESAAGVNSGGRTGLTAVVTGILLLASLFFSPIVKMVGDGVVCEVPHREGPVTPFPGTATEVVVTELDTSQAAEVGQPKPSAPKPVVEPEEGKVKYVTVFRREKRYPVIAPVLILVGCMMLATVVRINWTDYTEAIPAFLTMTIMPLTFNITDGIAWGFISLALLKSCTGRAKEANWIVYLFAVLFVLRYAFLRA